MSFVVSVRGNKARRTAMITQEISKFTTSQRYISIFMSSRGNVSCELVGKGVD